MERIVIPGEIAKGRIPRDDNYLQHELIKIDKEIRRLQKRRDAIRATLKKSDSVQYKESFYEKQIKLYVLELENGKYYVGQTRNVQQRYLRHSRGKGANWTKLHKPVGIIKVVNTKITDEHEAAILENQLTFEMAVQYGPDNVRGGGYCQTKPKWPQSVYDELLGLSARL